MKFLILSLLTSFPILAAPYQGTDVQLICCGWYPTPLTNSSPVAAPVSRFPPDSLQLLRSPFSLLFPVLFPQDYLFFITSHFPSIMSANFTSVSVNWWLFFLIVDFFNTWWFHYVSEINSFHWNSSLLPYFQSTLRLRWTFAGLKDKILVVAWIMRWISTCSFPFFITLICNAWNGSGLHKRARFYVGPFQCPCSAKCSRDLITFYICTRAWKAHDWLFQWWKLQFQGS